MSRVGKKPVELPAGVTVVVDGNQVTAKGPKGELSLSLPAGVGVTVNGNLVQVSAQDAEKQTRANHGTARSLIANLCEGVSKGYQRSLEIHGVGYRAAMQGNRLVMSVGYSHPVEYDIPEGVTVTVADNTTIHVDGTDKQQVGLVSARIRGFCPPEPYKGKGVRYKGEHVRRKVGKTVA